MKRLSFALAIALAMLSCAIQTPNQLPMLELPTETNALAIRPKSEPKLPTIESALAIATVTASQSLNVRERADWQQVRVLGVLYHGDQVELTGTCSGVWAEIVWEDGTAWVNSKFLSQNKCSEEK